MKLLPLSVVAAVAAALVSIFAADAAAQAKAGAAAAGSSAASVAAARLPEGANAVLTLDVAKLIASPWGKQIKLQAQLASGQADRPLPVSATAKRVTVGVVDPMSMDALWQAAVVESVGAPRLDPLLRAHGGYLDQIGGKQAAWSPRDVFYVALDDHTLGVVRPAQRPVVSRWVSAKGGHGGGSAYVSNALATAGNADGVFAIDLDDVVGVTALHYAVDMGQMPSLNPLEAGLDKLLEALATVKGITITMSAGNTLDGQCVIDFGQDVGALGAHAKPFVADVLTMAGFYEPDMAEWNFKAEGKRIVGKRAISEEGLKRMLGVLSPPNVGAAMPPDEDGFGGPAPKAAGPAGPAGPAKSPAAASQEYYRVVSKKLDTIAAKVSPTQTAGGLTAHGREIEQLPILNVDPELVKWGSSVADAFLRAAQQLALGQQNARTAAEGVASPVAYTTYTYNGSGGNSTPETRAAYRNAQQQRLAASQAQRTAAATQAFAILNDVLPARARIRVDMTQKYGVEF